MMNGHNLHRGKTTTERESGGLRMGIVAMAVVRPGKETRGKSTMPLITRLEDSKSMITTGIMMKKWRRSDPRNVDIIQTEYFKPPIMIVTKTQVKRVGQENNLGISRETI
ncbi:hypothetical protein ACOMHN_000098 [Nucella lapillus]